MNLQSRAAYASVRASWTDFIKYHGFSEEYDRANYERARSHWARHIAGDNWLTAATATHHAYWASLGRSCPRETCDLHGEEDHDDDSIRREDYFGDGVYQPETDPQKIAAAERSLNALRERLSQPAW